MNSPSRMTVGTRRRNPSTRSSSRSRATRPMLVASRGMVVKRAASVAPPTPPAIGRERFSGIVSLQQDDALRLGLDLLHLRLRPLHRVLGLHSLDRLGVHVGDDVLRLRLRRRTPWWPGIPVETERARGGPVRQHDGIELPLLVVLRVGRRAHAESFLGVEPRLDLLLAVEPLEEVLRELLILRVAHHRVAERRMEVEDTRWPGRVRRVQDVGVHQGTLVGLVLLLVPQRLDVDRRAVGGRRARTGPERSVVVRVVPREAALVAGVLPEPDRELHRLDRLLGVDGDSPPVLLDLLTAPRPHERVPEHRRVPEAVPGGLADRVPLGLELLADLPVLLPRLREFIGADFFEQGLSIGDLAPDDRVRDSAPGTADLAELRHRRVEAALSFAGRLGDVAHVHQALLVEDRKSTRLNSSHVRISYAVFCLKKKTKTPIV